MAGAVGLLLWYMVLTTIGCLALNVDESNEVSISPPINLDANLRKALLKALTDLENEDNEKSGKNEIDKVVEKASASAVSIFTNSEMSTSPTTATTSEIREMKIPFILVQRSQGVQHTPITTVEKEELDPFNDAEQILTSASKSFTLPIQASFSKSNQEIRDGDRGGANLTKDNDEVRTKSIQIETTTIISSTSTEENEAKVEDVQFFSAPLVAAFTVHQDEQGVPKKVEPIYKTNLKKKQDETKLQAHKFSKHEEFNELEKHQQQTGSLIEFQQQKQKALEQEILRLNLNLKQQQQFNQQQKEFFLKQQQEQFRLRNNAQPFHPLVNPTFRQFYTETPILNQFPNHIKNFGLNEQKPVENRFINNAIVSGNSLSGSQQLPSKPPQQFNENIDNSKNVSLLPSITYDPLIEAGKLPLNAQILPVKGPINFHTPIIQTASFQQFHSVPHINPTNPSLINNFNQLQSNHAQFDVNNHQPNRFLSQETQGSNLNNNLNNMSPTSFSLQKSIQSLVQVSPSEKKISTNNFNSLISPLREGNRFFRSNLESNFVSAKNFQQPQSYRFFRSSLESPFGLDNYDQSQVNNYQLSNLLFNSGAFKEKSPEDINLISKVLSLDYLGDNQFESSNRREQRKTFSKLGKDLKEYI